MDNLRRVLQGIVLDFTNVICGRMFLTQFEWDDAAMNTIYTTYFAPGRLPAQTTVVVTPLARDGIIAIDLVAKRG